MKMEFTELVAPTRVTCPAAHEDTISGPRGYIVTHLPDRIVGNRNFAAVYCGAAADTKPPGTLSDILKDGTRLVNRRWSELSAIYRIWQDGPRSDIVGFSHYRRFLSFDKDHRAPIIQISRNDLEASEALLWDAEAINKVSRDYYIVPKPEPLRRTIIEHYTRYHSIHHYELAAKIAIQRFPDIAPQFELHKKENALYSNNLFFLPWSDFCELCEFWFSILHTFCEEISWPLGNHYQDRDVAFLSERLFDAWIRAKQSAGVHLDERSKLFIRDWRNPSRQVVEPQ